MPVQDPPWKQKTRPCPFYSQGHCLFADSCNFLHNVTVKRPDSTLISPVHQTPISPPTTMVHSPPRSPRMSSLLLALGNAIHRDAEDDEPSLLSTDNEPPQVILTTPDRFRSNTPLLENDETTESTVSDSELFHLSVGLEDISHDLSDEEAPMDESSASPTLAAQSPALTTGVIEYLGSESPSLASTVVQTPENVSPAIASTIFESLYDGSPASIESPVEGSPAFTANIVESLRDESHAISSIVAESHAEMPARSLSPGTNTVVLEDDLSTSIDTSDPEVSQSPLASIHSPSYSHPSGLLSPIELAPSPPLCLPTEHFFDRDDSIDSGYADGWTGPTPLKRTPPRRLSTLSLLSSPFGTPSSRVLSAHFGNFDPSAPPAAAVFSPTFAAFQHHHAAHHTRFHDSHPASADESGSSHAKSESKSEIGFKLSSPIIEASESAFSTKTLKEASTDVFGGTGYEPSPAGSLAYTLPVASPEGDLVFQDSSSPTLRVGIISAADNTDAVNTLYDGYYSPVSTDPAIHAVEASTARPDHHPELPDSQSHSSPTLVSTPLRVFSPSDASLRDSLVIKTSPAASQSVLQDRTPRVFSAGPRPEFVHQEQELPEGGSQHSSTNESSEKPTSTKVPFGFRHSVSNRSMSSHSSNSLSSTRRRPPMLDTVLSEKSRMRDSQVMTPEEPLPSASHLKPLRLSMLLSSSSGSLFSASSITPSLTTASTANTPLSPTVSSEYSLSNNRLLSSPSSALIPARIRSPVVSPHDSLSHFSSGTPSYSPLSSGPVPRNPSWHRSRLSIISSRRSSRIYQRPDSRQSEPFALYDQLEEDEFESDDKDRFDETIRRPVSSLSTGSFRPPSVVPSPSHAIATPRPTLLFALASNDVDEVRRVLESGEARPNDDVGPQSALAFTLTSDQLTNKVAIVKLLLAHGADTSFLKPQTTDSPSVGGRNPPSSAMAKILENMDPAVRYYISKAEAPQTRRASALIHRSFFRPLAKVRYDLVGQDRALEQLFRALSMPSMAPLVVLLCGPSGHGKSLLARRFGSLLDVPTHTVNMTTLRSTHDIWRSYSMSPYEAPSTCTLATFLLENEGKRCVVVLDEIEKVEDEKYLSSLLMPWEFGNCSFEAGRRHVNVSQVIWLATSNIGHDLVFEHQKSRQDPAMQMSREEYVDLMALLRPRVSERLGASLLSRVTTVLPFVPFTVDEQMAIAAEAFSSLAGEFAKDMPPATIEMIVRTSLSSYIPAEGARSLYRAVSTQLLDTV